jgi:hypothetical protein
MGGGVDADGLVVEKEAQPGRLEVVGAAMGEHRPRGGLPAHQERKAADAEVGVAVADQDGDWPVGIGPPGPQPGHHASAAPAHD